jgi:hypothetical protein
MPRKTKPDKFLASKRLARDANNATQALTRARSAIYRIYEDLADLQQVTEIPLKKYIATLNKALLKEKGAQ